MVDEFVHNNAWDLAEERFVRLEEQVIDISCNMILMAALANNLGPFGLGVGGSNSEIKSDGKSRDNEDHEKAKF